MVSDSLPLQRTKNFYRSLTKLTFTFIKHRDIDVLFLFMLYNFIVIFYVRIVYLTINYQVLPYLEFLSVSIFYLFQPGNWICFYINYKHKS